MSILENNTLWIKKARLGFPAIAAPKAVVQGSDPKYQATFILTPDAPEWGEMVQIITAMATEKWGENVGNVMNMIKTDKRLRCYGVGAEKIATKTGKVYDGFEGMNYISASNADQPKLYGQDAQELPPTANINQKFTGGNYVSGIISFWLQDNQFGKGIRANLNGVQYVEEGEHFGNAGPDTGGIFQAVEGAPAATGGMPVVAAADPAAPAVATPAVPVMNDPSAFI